MATHEHFGQNDARLRQLLDYDDTTAPSGSDMAILWVPAGAKFAPRQVVLPTDARLTNARTPTAHAHATSDITNLTALLAPSNRMVYPGGPYGVVGDGVADDAAAIRSAIAATPAGGTCLVAPGRYRTRSTLVVPPNVTLQFSHAPALQYQAGSPVNPCVIIPDSTFTGPAVIRIVDKTTGGYATDSVNTRLINIAIEGGAAPSGTKGIQLYGRVREARILNCSVAKMTGDAFECAGYSPFTNDAIAPQSNRFEGCYASDGTGAGFVFAATPDMTVQDCTAEGMGYVGFYIAGLPNGKFIGCRAEWSANSGFYLTSGSWGAGQGSGGAEFTGCSTDRNNFNGVLIDATGNAPITFNGLQCRRDGRNGGAGGGSYSAVSFVNATNPIIIDGLVVYPGVNDDGTGTVSPERGITYAGTNSVVVGSGYIHAVTTPVVDSGTIGSLIVANVVGRATGPTATPTRVPPSALVPSTPYTMTYAATMTPDARLGNSVKVTATGNLTLNAPTAPIDTQMLMFSVLASGAARTVTIAAAIQRTTGLAGTVTITSGKVGFFGLRYSALSGNWTLLAQTTEL